MASIDTLMIRIAGQFNPRVFAPSWVIKNLTIGSQILKGDEIELGFDIERQSLVYSFRGITFAPTETDLRIEFGKKDESRIVYGTKVFLKLLKLIDLSPVKAIGFNIIYRLKDISESKFLAIFDSQSEIKIDESSSAKPSRVLFHADSGIENCILNILSSNKDQKGYTVEFNYHFIKFDGFTSKLLWELKEDSQNKLN